MRFPTLVTASVPAMALAQDVIMVVEVKTVTAIATAFAWTPQDRWHDHDWQHQDSPPQTTPIPAASSSSTPLVDIPTETTLVKMQSPTYPYTHAAATISPAAPSVSSGAPSVSSAAPPTISSAAATMSSAAPAYTPAVGSTDNSLSNAILNSTNFFRSRYEAAPLTWNQEAAEFAQSWASRCVFSHSGGDYGENIAAAWPDLSASNGVDMWGNEEANYNWANPGFSDSTGHFTQLVWQATTSVGCALVACNNPKGIEGGSFLVCEYSPGGNVLDQFATNVRKPGLSKKGVPGLGERSAAGRVGFGRTVAAALVVASTLLPGIL